MTRRIRTIAVTAATAVATLGLASAAQAHSLPIQGEQTGVSGVLTGKAKCINGRTITVHDAKGKQVGRDIATPNGNGAAYAVGGLLPGKYFAKAKATKGCSALTSKKVTLRASAAFAVKAAKTNLSLQHDTGGFAVYVSSANMACASNRAVTLKLGKKVVGRATAQADGDGSGVATFKVSKAGKYQASIAKTKACKAASSNKLAPEMA